MFGAGEAGTALINRLLAEPDAAYRPVALLDDDPDKRRLRVHGRPGARRPRPDGRGGRRDRGHRAGDRDRRASGTADRAT